KVRFRDVWIGALVTGLIWKGVLAGFSWYMHDMSRFTRVNGSIAAVVVFLAWVYAQAVILLYGVEFTAAYARLRRGRPEEVPAAHAIGRVAARDDDGVEILRAGGAGREIGGDHFALLPAVPRAGRRAHDGHGDAGLLQRVARARHFAVLEFLFDQQRHALADC